MAETWKYTTDHRSQVLSSWPREMCVWLGPWCLLFHSPLRSGTHPRQPRTSVYKVPTSIIVILGEWLFYINRRTEGRRIVLKTKRKQKWKATLHGTFPFPMGDSCLHITSKSLNPGHESLNFSRGYSTLGLDFFSGNLQPWKRWVVLGALHGAWCRHQNDVRGGRKSGDI